jgi:hypothetical protein
LSVCVFTGPTISASEASRELEAIYLPPAAEGDVYRVSLQRPQAIGIIDGYFQSVPTVRHKEILWAMSHGIHVFGSASIGALRAAELAAFGMEGVGIVFELYRDRVLEDDDEVAIAHGPAEVGFQAASEAMVNIRQTLKKAELLSVVSKKFRAAVEKEGKKLFYPDRNYPSLLSCASEIGLPKAELSRFHQWWPRNRVNQKRDDAIAMLRLMRQRLAQGLKPKTVSYCFEQTAMWESVLGQRGEVRFDSDNVPTVVGLESLLNELRLQGNGYRQHSLLALGRFFAIQEAARLRMTVTSEDRRRTQIVFCQQRGLMNATQIEQWLKDNDLNDHQFDALITDEARVRWIEKRAHFASLNCLPEQLRLSGDYPRLAARAIAKDRLLTSLGLKNATLKEWNLTEGQLLHWYFDELLRQPLPDDPNRYARDLGFTSLDAFIRALLKEHLYRRFENQTKHRDDPGPRIASDLLTGESTASC